MRQGLRLFLLLLSIVACSTAFCLMQSCKWIDDTALTNIDGRSIIFQFTHLPAEFYSLSNQNQADSSKLIRFLAVFEVRGGIPRFAMKIINGVRYSSTKKGIYSYKKVLPDEGILSLMESVNDQPETDATTFTMEYANNYSGTFTMQSSGSTTVEQGTFAVVREENSAQYF